MSCGRSRPEAPITSANCADGDDGKLNVTTKNLSFGLIVTAEPIRSQLASDAGCWKTPPLRDQGTVEFIDANTNCWAAANTSCMRRRPN